MALIKCPECNKDISDECKVCIHCGYTLKKEKKKNNEKFDILASFKDKKQLTVIKNFVSLTSLQIMALVCLICSFVINFFDVVYNRYHYPSLASTYTYKYPNALFDTWSYVHSVRFLIPIIIIFFALSVIAILLFNKLKRKIIIYIPNVVYSLIYIALLINGPLYHFNDVSYDRFVPAFAYYYIMFLSLLSIGFLVLDIINKRNKKASQ